MTVPRRANAPLVATPPLSRRRPPLITRLLNVVFELLLATVPPALTPVCAIGLRYGRRAGRTRRMSMRTVPALFTVRAAVVVQRAVAGEGQRAGVDDGRAGEGVAGGERQRAGAGLGDAVPAADRAGHGRAVGRVDRPGLVGGQGDVRAEGERAGAPAATVRPPVPSVSVSGSTAELPTVTAAVLLLVRLLKAMSAAEHRVQVARAGGREGHIRAAAGDDRGDGRAGGVGRPVRLGAVLRDGQHVGVRSAGAAFP